MSDKKSVKVLVVDDSGTIRKTAEAILTKEGYTVATAEDGFKSCRSNPTSSSSTS